MRLVHHADWGTPRAVRLYSWLTGQTQTVTDPALASLPLAWDASLSTWVRGGGYGDFNVPKDERMAWWVTITTHTGERRIIITTATSTPGLGYAYAFMSLDPTTDEDGNHWGVHPKRAFVLPLDTLALFRHRLTSTPTEAETKRAVNVRIAPNDLIVGRLSARTRVCLYPVIEIAARYTWQLTDRGWLAREVAL